jgi:hypothetical protein
VWKESNSGSEFGEANAILLAEELRERMNEAAAEWKDIDCDLAKWFGAEALVSAGIGLGTGHFLAAVPAAVIGGITNLAAAWSKRKDFRRVHPAMFFLDLERSYKA